MYYKGIMVVLSVAIAVCMGAEDRYSTNQYLRFGRGNYNGYMRFGRNSPPLDIDAWNTPVSSLEQDPFLRISPQGRDPFIRIGRGNADITYPQSDPILRIGRSSYYMKFGKREFPYHRYGRDYVPRNDAVDLFLNLDKYGNGFLKPDVEYSSLDGRLDDWQDVNKRKKRAINPQTEETPLQRVLGLTTADKSGTVSDFQDTEEDNKVLEDDNARETRSGGNQYMRFGKRNRLEYYGSNKYNLDKESGSSTGDQIEKRRNEYMRFGRTGKNLR